MQRQFLLSQMAEHRAKIAALDRQAGAEGGRAATTAATIHKLEAMIPVMQQRVDIRKTLMERELGSKLHLSRDAPAADRAAGRLERPEEPPARGGGGRGGDPRDARPGGGRVSPHTLLDELAKAEQRQTGSPRT